MLRLPNIGLVAVDVALPSSGFDRSADVVVRVKAHTLAVLMAYEVEEIWRAFDTALPANVRVRFAYTCFNMLNLFLLYDLYKSNPNESVCSLHNFATYAQHAATSWLGADGYRRMYDWIMQHFAPRQSGSRFGREPLAETVVNWWTTYKTFPSLSNERLSAAHRESHRQEAAALLRDVFALVHTLVSPFEVHCCPSELTDLPLARRLPVTRLPTRRPPTRTVPILPLFLVTVMPSSTRQVERRMERRSRTRQIGAEESEELVDVFLHSAVQLRQFAHRMRESRVSLAIESAPEKGYLGRPLRLLMPLGVRRHWPLSLGTFARCSNTSCSSP